MPYEVSVSLAAQGDLEDIFLYVSEALSSPIAADGFVKKVESCYSRLQENPFLYERCRDPRLSGEGYRRAVIGNFVMVYKVDEGQGLVKVYRFFYGGQNYSKYL
jgi:plasmid stabilization system protein ParE